MPLDPRTFCRDHLPALYAGAFAAAAPTPRPRELGATRPVAIAVHFTGEAEESLYGVLREGALTVHGYAPVEPPVFYALSVPMVLARQALEDLERSGLLESPQAPAVARLARAGAALASAKAYELFTATAYAFEVAVREVPDVGSVEVGVALGHAELAAEPEFRLVAAYEDVLDAHELGLGLQELLLSGRIRIAGDAAKAMMLAMTAAQLR